MSDLLQGWKIGYWLFKRYVQFGHISLIYKLQFAIMPSKISSIAKIWLWQAPGLISTEDFNLILSRVASKNVAAKRCRCKEMLPDLIGNQILH